MKRTAFVLALVFGLAAAGYGLEIGLGLQYGLRTVADSKIKDVYGNGGVYFPSVRIVVWNGLELGAGYEGGYKREGVIGLFQETTTLRVTGYEIFAGYAYRLGALEPYARVGYGQYAYKQTIDSASMPYKVDSDKSTVTLAAGLRYYPLSGAHLSLEAKYVPLEVKPIETEVNLGGFRLSVGIGYAFRL